MENTPMTPYQRNRRAGRTSAPPAPEAAAPETPAAQAPVQAAAPAAAPLQPSPAPLQTPAAPQPVKRATPAASAVPQPVKRAAPSPKALNAGPGWNMPAAPRPQQGHHSSYYGNGQYPGIQRTAHKPSSAARNDYYGDARYPVAQQPAGKPSSAARNDYYGEHKVPTWLLGALAVMLIGVMALFTWSVWMQKELRENADAREKAYQNILYEYHLTETDDGRLRVTYQDLIETYAAEYNLQPAFVTAIIRCESSFNTRAESGVGARGLMQMMPDTAEWVGRKLQDSFDYERLWEAETNIRYGCWYLNYLSEMFRGDPVMIAAAYHAGQGEVWSWLGDPAISPDGVTVPIENIPISNTRTYAGRVTKAYATYQALLYSQQSPEQDAVPAAGSNPVDDSLSYQR